MSVAGSGNKGIVCSVPLTVLEEERNVGAKKVEEALVLSMLFTSKTTEELGTLSAVCGCANAAGIGLACGLVYLQDGGDREISFAINNMVGNVTGMICDGAKIGCALKTMTSVDAAFRACAHEWDWHTLQRWHCRPHRQRVACQPGENCQRWNDSYR